MIRFLLLPALCAAPLAASDWPQFLGPEGKSTTSATGLPLEWDKKDKNVAWKVEVPGEGWSSPVVANGRIYLTTARHEGHTLHALCYSFADGKVLWDVEVFKNAEPPPKHKRNSYASPTPIIEGDRLYVGFGPMGYACLSAADGKKLWENRELKWEQQNGPGGSVAAYGDLLLIPCDGIDVQFEAALSKKDGKIVWRSERSAKTELEESPIDMRKAYGTPLIAQVAGKPVSFTLAASRLYALDPLTGKEQWFIKIPNAYSNVPIPATDGKFLYVSTGFNKPDVIAVKLEPATGDATATHVVWKQPKGGPTESSPVLAGNRLYMVNSTGIATCMDTADGKIIWSERLGPDFAATPLIAPGRVYFFDTWAHTYVVEQSDTFKVLATNRLDTGCMASPAVVGNALVVRTKTHLYRIEGK